MQLANKCQPYRTVLLIPFLFGLINCTEPESSAPDAAEFLNIGDVCALLAVNECQCSDDYPGQECENVMLKICCNNVTCTDSALLSYRVLGQQDLSDCAVAAELAGCNEGLLSQCIPLCEVTESWGLFAVCTWGE